MMHDNDQKLRFNWRARASAGYSFVLERRRSEPQNYFLSRQILSCMRFLSYFLY